MKLIKILMVVTLAMFAASVAHADATPACSVDSTIHPNTQSGHSDLAQSSGVVNFTVGADGCAQGDLAVGGGTITQFTISIPLADLSAPNFCARSNSYFTTLLGLVGTTANGMFTCTYYTASTNPNPKLSSLLGSGDGSGETLAQMQADCLQFGILDADDCLGTPTGMDLVTIITGLSPNLQQGETFTAAYTALGVPEPASLSMLLFGLAGLPFARRKFAR